MPKIIEDMLPVVETPIGPAVGITTVHGVKYAPGVTLAQGLEIMNSQIAESAALVAKNEATLTAVVDWLTRHFDYQPPPTATPDTYLTPLFAQLPQTPGDADGGA